MNAMLCCAILGLDPVATPADMEFTRVRIEQVAARKGVWEMDHALPQGHATLIRQLGHRRQACRERAAEALAALGMDAFEALTWGTLQKDAAIATTSRRLLRACYRCRGCAGGGEVENEVYGDCVDMQTCPDCLGSGDVRFVGEDMIPRVVFPGRK